MKFNLVERISQTLFFLSTLFLPVIVVAGGNIISVPSSGNATISAAMIKARPGDTVVVENGTYRERIFIKSGVTLKAQNTHKAVIDGMGRGTVITMGSNSSIIGCAIQNGTIGIFAKNAGISIANCFIVRNWQTGIITVRHLPKIEDNIIVFNRASAIQGWDVRSTVASINHNTLAFNGNNGVAMGGKSNVIIENNVIAFNERFALKISDESAQSKIMKNNFYKNLRQTLPSGNYSFDPAFMAPRTTMNFKSDPKMCCQIKASDNENLGVRYGQ